MAKLPIMPDSDGIHKTTQTAFGGYNHNVHAGNGDIWDMENMSGEEMPILTPRQPRYKIMDIDVSGECCSDFYARDGFFWVAGGKLYEKNAGEIMADLKPGKKIFASLCRYIIILPDNLYCIKKEKEGDGTVYWESGSLAHCFNEELDPQKTAVFYKDNPIPDMSTRYSVMELPSDAHEFRAGDSVTVMVFKSMQTYEHIKIQAVIREVQGKYLSFHENTFLEVVKDQNSVQSTVLVHREVPELDFVCDNDNRLWGCKGDTIYASKLGDPFNWNVFDGISTDSYAVNVGSAGDFTACCSYLGYPMFFKEDCIYKVYGNKPSNYQVMHTASLGVQAGSHLSLAVAGEQLFYLSRKGVMCYSGSIPANLSEAFGDEAYKNGTAGSDGVKYYISMENAGGEYSLFVYNTGKLVWHREDNIHAVNFGFNNGLHFLDSNGVIWLAGGPGILPDPSFSWERESDIHSMVEFGDFYEGGADYSGVSKLQIRLEADAGAEIEVAAQFDNDGVWRRAALLTPQQKRSYYLPIIPRRSDHFRLRIKGVGMWRLFSLSREIYHGSQLR